MDIRFEFFKTITTFLIISSLILSSCNNNRKMTTYTYNNPKITDKLTLKQIDDLHVEFEFTHIDNNNPSKNYILSGVAENADPDGGADFDFLDPSGEGNPMELYLWENDNRKLDIIIPMVTVDYVGIEYKAGDNEEYKVTLTE
jgi:hypothetical protein